MVIFSSSGIKLFPDFMWTAPRVISDPLDEREMQTAHGVWPMPMATAYFMTSQGFIRHLQNNL